MKPVEALAWRFAELDVSRLLRPDLRAFVYFLSHGDEVVYVGQTSDVMERVRLHLQDERVSGPKAFDRVFFLEVDALDLDAYEGALIRALNPRYCQRAPKDVGRDEEVLALFGLERDETGAFAARSTALYREAHPRIA